MGGPVQFSDITEDKLSGFNQETNSRREQLLLLLTNLNHAQLARETTDKLIGLPSQVVPYPKPEETESEVSDPMIVQNQTVTRSQTGTLVRPLDRFSPRREM